MSLRVLVSKELKELIREPQVIIVMVILPALMYGIMGVVMKASLEVAAEQVQRTEMKMAIIDNDGGVYARLFKTLLERLGEPPANISRTHIVIVNDPAVAEVVIVLPKGFTDNLSKLEPVTVVVKARVSDISVVGMAPLTITQSIVEQIGSMLASLIISEKGVNVSARFLHQPIDAKTYVVFRGVELAGGEANMLASSMFMLVFGPLIVVGYAASISAASMGAEREEKTLEVLLSLPVKRSDIVVAKLFASTILALLGSLSVTIGLAYFMYSMALPSIEVGSVAASAVAKVFRTIDPTGFVFVGASLVTTILLAGVVGLAAGALTQSIRGAQSVAGVVFFVVFIAAFPMMFIQLPTQPGQILVFAAVPFAAPVVVLKAVLVGNITVALYAVAFSLAYLAVSILVLARMLSSEIVITGFARGSRGKLRAFSR